MSYWVYMLWCGDGSIYTGHTSNLELRLAEHRRGEIPGYTREHLSVKLIWCEEVPTRDDALVRERQIKGWTRRKKLSLARGDFESLVKFSRGPSVSHRHAGPSTSSG